SRRRHTRFSRDWSSDVCSSDLGGIRARDKGQLVADSIFKKVARIFEQQGIAPFRETSIELLGSEATYGPHSRCLDSREVIIKMRSEERRVGEEWRSQDAEEH